MKTRTSVSFFTFMGLASFLFQSCTHDVYIDPQATDKASYENADAVNGSKLFNNFEHVDAGWPADAIGWPDVNFANDPTISIAGIANPPTGVTGQKNRSFYTCSGCHAYDGLGREGGYITKTLYTASSGAATAGAPTVAVSKLKDCKDWDITTLFNAIKNVGGRGIDPALTVNGFSTPAGNAHPDYSKILSDDKIWDLVKWLKEGAVYNEANDLYTMTTTGAYNTTITPMTTPPTVVYSNWGGTDGDAVAGDAFYVAKCMVCHGNGGRGTSLASGPSGITVNNTKNVQIGDFVRTRTPEAIHKIISGQFGSSPWMCNTPITRDEMKNLLKALGNTTKYPSGAITPNKIAD
jgi:mono/diheme cytochrome c family protein